MVILATVTLIALQKDVLYSQSMEQELAKAESYFNYGRRAESMPSVYGHWLPKAYEDALAIYKKYGVRSGEVIYVCNYLGIYYKRKGDYGRAMDYYKWGLPIAKELNISLDHLLVNMGNLYSLHFQFLDAISYYKQALEVVNKENDKKVDDNLLIALGLSYLNLGEYEKAQTYLERTLALSKAADDNRRIEIAYGNLALLNLNQGNYKKAQEFCNAYTSISQRQSATLGEIYLTKGEVNDAILIFKNLEDSLLLGKAYLIKKDFSNSLKCFQAALNNEELKWNDSNYLLATYIGLGQTFEGMGNHNNARIYYKNATELISTPVNMLETAQKERFLNVERYGFKRKDAFIGLERVSKGKQ